MTSSALDGKLQSFTADEIGNKEKAREMATCSAWIPMDDSEINVEEEYLFPTVSTLSFVKIAVLTDHTKL